MQPLFVERSIGELLKSQDGQVLLCDADGRAIGFFSPLPAHPLVEDLRFEPPLSIAETEELRKDRTGKPLSAILDRLGI
jgi:hypothetical protein